MITDPTHPPLCEYTRSVMEFCFQTGLSPEQFYGNESYGKHPFSCMESVRIPAGFALKAPSITFREIESIDGPFIPEAPLLKLYGNFEIPLGFCPLVRKELTLNQRTSVPPNFTLQIKGDLCLLALKETPVNFRARSKSLYITLPSIPDDFQPFVEDVCHITTKAAIPASWIPQRINSLYVTSSQEIQKGWKLTLRGGIGFNDVRELPADVRLEAEHIRLHRVQKIAPSCVLKANVLRLDRLKTVPKGWNALDQKTLHADALRDIPSDWNVTADDLILLPSAVKIGAQWKPKTSELRIPKIKSLPQGLLDAPVGVIKFNHVRGSEGETFDRYVPSSQTLETSLSVERFHETI